MEAAILRGLGVKAGVPDILIFNPIGPEFEFVGLALELKAPKGRTTDAQHDWHSALRLRHWRVEVVDNIDAALRLFLECGYLRRR